MTLEKGKEKNDKCKTKVQLTVTNTVEGQEYTASLGEVEVKKTADSETTTFMFNFGKKVKVLKLGKGKKPEEEETNCPNKGETLTGYVNDVPVSVTITSDKKPTKYSIDLPTQ